MPRQPQKQPLHHDIDILKGNRRVSSGRQIFVLATCLDLVLGLTSACPSLMKNYLKCVSISALSSSTCLCRRGSTGKEEQQRAKERERESERQSRTMEPWSQVRTEMLEFSGNILTIAHADNETLYPANFIISSRATTLMF